MTFFLINIDILLKGLFWIGLKFLNSYRYIRLIIFFNFKAYCNFIDIRILTKLKLFIFFIINNLNF